MGNLATFRLIGNLGFSTNNTDKQLSRVSLVTVSTPVKLRAAISKIEDDYEISLPRDSVLILVNGIEANALDDLDTIINGDDEIVLVPIFHGG